ncbi:MAG: 50S ribosomal protein L4 [Candidatus Omnitrophica bacterium]|nr:50S ribosomal protein L4 [Candidatus Omnitrophota bacterium]
MSKITVYKLNGSQSGEMELNPLIFNAEINQRLLDLILTAYAGNQRRGTHDTKERKEVSGGGKKPWRQKGTGRARQGSIRAPQWRGGGTIFGPTPRDYDTKISQAIRGKALISALSLRNKQERIWVIENTELAQPKTKELRSAINLLKLGSAKTLCVVASVDEKLKRASNNLKEVFLVKRANDLNAYHVLRRKQLVIEKSALALLEKRLLEDSEPSNEKQLVTA